MIRELIIFLLLLCLLVFILIRIRKSENKRLRSKVLESMSPELRKEIEEERKQALEKKKRFEEAMRQAGGK